MLLQILWVLCFFVGYENGCWDAGFDCYVVLLRLACWSAIKILIKTGKLTCQIGIQDRTCTGEPQQYVFRYCIRKILRIF